MSQQRTVREYLASFYSGRPETARFLGSEFKFSGSSASFDTVASFLKASAHAAASVEKVEIEKTFEDGSDVCAFYTLHLNHRVPKIQVAEWFHFVDERIASIRLVMDTAPFLKPRASEVAETAVDPVCHMSVEKASAPAMREHNGETYYFCSAGCAAAFSKSPEHYSDIGN